MGRDWVKSKPGAQRRITKENFRAKNKYLDRGIQCTERQYWYTQQDELNFFLKKKKEKKKKKKKELMDSIIKDQHQFWKNIGRVVGCDRHKSMELLISAGSVLSSEDVIMNGWHVHFE